MERATHSKEIEIKEIKNLKKIKSVLNNPKKFLEVQNSILYSKDMSVYWNDNSRIGKDGLPISTKKFYKSKKRKKGFKFSGQRRISVLNIGSGNDVSKKLEAVNIDILNTGIPDNVADAKKLPYADGIFSVIRASHVLEHIDQNSIVDVLVEWKRILHRNGELHIAVPDANIVFNEMINSRHTKRKNIFLQTMSSPALAQIYGIGYNNPGTNKLWSHKIIFNYILLKSYLETAGFEVIKIRNRQEDLAFLCGVDDDSQNHYSLLVSAKRKPEKNSTERTFSSKQSNIKTRRTIKKHSRRMCASYIIPVHNESKNLKRFINSLKGSLNSTRLKREFIFVVNGCTDNSRQIIINETKKVCLDSCKIVKSKTGIVNAFISGIKSRSFNGFVGKIDADIYLDEKALDLMESCLIQNDGIQVTYAEPIPKGRKNIYNEAEYVKNIRSKRLYIHGRTSLYRSNPFFMIKSRTLINKIAVEDILFSFYFAYYYGLSSIRRAPGAVVYSKPIKSIIDLANQIARTNKEKEIIFKYCPNFRILDKLFYREIYSKKYRNLLNIASGFEIKAKGSHWTRIESTK